MAPRVLIAKCQVVQEPERVGMVRPQARARSRHQRFGRCDQGGVVVIVDVHRRELAPGDDRLRMVVAVTRRSELETALRETPWLRDVSELTHIESFR